MAFGTGVLCISTYYQTLCHIIMIQEVHNFFFIYQKNNVNDSLVSKLSDPFGSGSIGFCFNLELDQFLFLRFIHVTIILKCAAINIPIKNK